MTEPRTERLAISVSPAQKKAIQRWAKKWRPYQPVSNTLLEQLLQCVHGECTGCNSACTPSALPVHDLTPGAVFGYPPRAEADPSCIKEHAGASELRLNTKTKTKSCIPEAGDLPPTLDTEGTRMAKRGRGKQDDLFTDGAPSLAPLELCERIIASLNTEAGTHYMANTPNTRRLIQARLKEGFVEEDFQRAIKNQVIAWKGAVSSDGTPMAKYLRPETLFGPKFNSYQGANTSAVKPGGGGFVSPGGTPDTSTHKPRKLFSVFDD